VDKPNQPHSFFSVGTSNRYSENPIYPTSNVIYRKAVFDELGGFDPATADGDWRGVVLECSDADLAWMVIGCGYRTGFVPELVVYHEVRREPLLKWLATQLRVMYIPMIIQRHPAIRRSLLWFGPFAAPENLFFYVAAAGLAVAMVTGSLWWLLGVAPLLIRFLPYLRPSWIPLRWPKLVAQFALILVRQSLICGFLLYGSFRSRTVVL
jgi:cellulose synthase/poly-beta-1,6-N-acetylglucosamine synthase-like glycosyltransferase